VKVLIVVFLEEVLFLLHHISFREMKSNTKIRGLSLGG